MRISFHYFITVLCAFVLASCGATRRITSSDVIYPADYGVLQAKTGSERYAILYNCHTEAVERGKDVSYKGIEHLLLEIPQNASPIPLSSRTDFAGVTIEVLNNTKNAYLFQLTQQLIPVDLSGSSIDKASFSRNPKLSRGDCLLVIKDETPWVDNRSGYNYGAERRDIMRVHNGRGQSNVVQSYQTSSSRPQCLYCSLNGEPIVFKNVVFIRNGKSSKMTFLVRMENHADVTISNVTIKTPIVGDKFGDVAITVNNVAGLTLRDIKIEGTYFQTNKYGYGVSLNNISGLIVERMKAHPNWGVFGNNNVNNALIRDCDINRFDIHCYGKDISFENCIFTGMYNQFSSIYGKVIFKKCEFIDFFPVLFESSYNAYTLFDLYFNKCVVYASPKRDCLIYGGNLDGGRTNGRSELSQQAFPNLYIKGLTVYLPKDSNIFYIYRLSSGHLRWPKDSIPGVKVIKDFMYRE